MSTVSKPFPKGASFSQPALWTVCLIIAAGVQLLVRRGKNLDLVVDGLCFVGFNGHDPAIDLGAALLGLEGDEIVLLVDQTKLTLHREQISRARLTLD